MWKYFPVHIKAEDIAQFNIFHILAENSVNPVLYFFWVLLQAAKIRNSSKMPMFWQLKLPSNLKIVPHFKNDPFRTISSHFFAD